MNYAEKLKDPRWQRKRLEVFDRDRWTCRNCGKGDMTLIVHHACYFAKREPWEYDNRFLYTLCTECHEDETEKGSSSFFIIHTSLLLAKEHFETIMEALDGKFDKSLSLQLDAVISLLDEFRI